MKLVVGLGNLGKRYLKNRHNVGFFVVDNLRSTVDSNAEWDMDKKFKAEVCSPKAVSALLAKPQTMMNNSGKAVSALTTYYKLHSTDIYVIHDDLDIKLGEYKIQLGKGPKDHKGIESINQALGTMDYWRVRVGVDNRSTVDGLQTTAGERRIPGEKYVLQDFTEVELEIINGVIDDIVEDLRVRMLD